MPESSFWSLKIEGGDVFIYLGKDRLKLQKVYGKVLSVEKSTFKRATTLQVRIYLFQLYRSNSSTRCYLSHVCKFLTKVRVNVICVLQFRFEPCPKGTHTKCHLKLKYFNRHNSDVNFKKMKETSHDEWVLRFNQEIERLNSVSRTATTAVNESSPKTVGVSMSARVCDDNEGGTSLNTSSDRSTSLRESTDLEITHITGNASSSGMIKINIIKNIKKTRPFPCFILLEFQSDVIISIFTKCFNRGQISLSFKLFRDSIVPYKIKITGFDHIQDAIYNYLERLGTVSESSQISECCALLP